MHGNPPGTVEMGVPDAQGILYNTCHLRLSNLPGAKADGGHEGSRREAHGGDNSTGGGLASREEARGGVRLVWERELEWLP